tara:strand:- start:89 stop:334 length:246 start_codon:yes stop_codon:yes gene_type:complete
MLYITSKMVQKMLYETNKMAIYEGLDKQNVLIKYKIPCKKNKATKEANDKTISKMLRKKLTRYVDKKNRSNIKRKAYEYNF